MNIYILILTLILSSCFEKKKSLAEIKSQIKINLYNKLKDKKKYTTLKILFQFCLPTL